MRRTILLGSVAALVLLASAPAAAVWGGTPDGDRHPMVGAMYVDYFPQDGQITWEEQFCSGSYAGLAADGQSKVFLTAAHCLAWVASQGFDTLYVDYFPQDGQITWEEQFCSGSYAALRRMDSPRSS